jgi:hypothetical protein
MGFALNRLGSSLRSWLMTPTVRILLLQGADPALRALGESSRVQVINPG